MSELCYFDVPNFALQKGTILPVARLAYRTLGTLNQAKDNAVLLTTGITLDDDLTEMYFCGGDRALDPKKYFMIRPIIWETGARLLHQIRLHPLRWLASQL